MKALVYRGPGKKSLEDRPKPAIVGASDAIVRVTRTTICGTDLHILKGDVPSCAAGRILGHEGVGIIDQVGTGVADFKPGDAVLISCITACGKCTYCRKQMYSHCTTGGWFLGNRIDGTQAEFVRIPHADTSLYHIPAGADEEALVMLSDILPTGFECGVLNGRVAPGSVVAIVGAGPIGLAALLTAQFYAPAEVIMLDLDDHRLAVAKRFGSTSTVNSSDGKAVATVMKMTDGRGVDTAIEAVGIPATFELCTELVAPGGTVANIGVHGTKVDLHLESLWDRNITITTRLVDTVSTPMLLNTRRSHRLDPKLLITHHFKLAQILEAYQTFGNAGRTLKTFYSLSDQQLESRLADAASCFSTWRHKAYQERAVIVSKAGALMRDDVDHFAGLATLEMGKRIEEACGETHMESSPIGVIFCIEPWNFPFYQLARVAGRHLMAGNTLVVKHSSNVPQCAIAFEKLWIDAGAPVGLYTNLLISHAQSDHVIDDRRIKGVARTGSVEAGRSVAARAGQILKPSSMELGGSDAFIVLDDADLEKAVPWAVWGRMYNQGQICCASKRFIVQESIADRFLEKLSAALALQTAGNPMDEKTTKGPMSQEVALVELLRQVDSAVAHGARVLMGGKRMDRPGSFMETTILTDVKPGNPAFRTEFFGPVALFFRVKDEEAAIAPANDSDFGLGGSAFTSDLARGQRLPSRIDTGMMFINNIDGADAELPFGGVKNSGYGRELGDMGIQAFVNRKLVRTAAMAAPA